MKKIVLNLLVIAMVFMCVFSTDVVKAETSGSCGENLTWEISNGVLTISGTGNMDSWNYANSVYAPWYSQASSIKKIVIEDGVTSIGHSAFYHFYGATKIIVPASVTSINTYAFSNCNSIKTIGPAGSGANYEYGWKTTIPSFAFSGFYGCTSITIAEGITTLSGSICTWCTALTKVTLPSTLQTIGTYAFYKCSALRSIYIPGSVTTLGANAFNSCSSSLNVTFGCGSTLTDETIKAALISNYTREAHNLAFVEAKEPTCTEEENHSYYNCSRCRNLFKDENGSEKTTKSEVTISPLNHNYQSSVTTEPTCEMDGVLTYVCQNDSSHTYTEVISKTGHNYSSTITVEPTCLEKGVRTYTCANDPSHTYTEAVAALGHSLVHIPRVEPTTKSEGNIEYWKCSRCGKCFSDDSGRNEISEGSTALAKTKKDYTSKVTKEPTCTEDGVRTFTNTKDSKDTYTEVIKKLGHQLTHYERVEPTKTTEGVCEYWYCSRCGKYFIDQNCKTSVSKDDLVLPVTTYTSEIIKEPTCTEPGERLFKNVDDETDTYTEEIPALGHNLTHVEAVEAKRKQPGNIEYWYCSECNKYFADEECKNELTIDQLEVLYKAPIALYAAIGGGVIAAACLLIFLLGGKKCPECGKKVKKDQKVCPHCGKSLE